MLMLRRDKTSQKKPKNVCIKNITGKISINVFIDGTKKRFALLLLCSLSATVVLQGERERESERGARSQCDQHSLSGDRFFFCFYQAAALAAAVDAIRDRAPMRSTTRAVAAAAAEDKQE